MVSITHLKVSHGDLISFQENDARVYTLELRERDPKISSRSYKEWETLKGKMERGELADKDGQ